MLISTQTGRTARVFGDIEAIRLLAKAGYDALDYSFFIHSEKEHPVNSENHLEYAAELKKAAEEQGVFFNQAHSHFPSYREGDEVFNEQRLKDIKRSIAFAGVLGVKELIVHPFPMKDKNIQMEKNLAFYNELLPLCKEHNVKIALENMFGRNSETKRICPNVCSTGEELALYLEQLDSDWFCACADIGHFGLIGQDADKAIRALGGEKLKCLHVHDNNGLEDMHTLPFTVDINWDAVIQALADIGYDGDLTLEADDFISGFPPGLLPDGIKMMSLVARHIANEIESRKKT